MTQGTSFRPPTRFAILPIPLFIALIVLLHVALPAHLDASLAFDPPVLMLVLNTLLLFGVSLAVLVTALRAYVASGASNILLLGCGMLALGVAALVGGWVRPLGGTPNTSVTVHNLGVLLGAALYGMSATLSLLGADPEPRVERRRRKLVLGLVGTCGLMAAITAAAARGLVPPFWDAAVGSTPVKQAVLGTAVALLALTAIYTMSLYLRTRRRFLYWYALALALTCIGLVGISLMKAVGGPIGWLGRTAQYLGGAYFLAAVLSALRDVRAEGLTLRAAIDRFYRESEVHYRDLLNTVNDAIISFDDGNTVLLWNEAATRVLGYTSGEAAGRLLRELLTPKGQEDQLHHALEDLQQRAAGFFAARAIEIPLRRKDGSVFPSETSLSVRRSGSGWIGTIVVRDITERKRTEERLRAALAENEAALADNETLLREVHHRVKNNLQILCDMLYLQMETVGDEKADVLRDTYGRIYAIARLHEQLYQSMQSGLVHLEQYLGRLTSGFGAVYPKVPVKLEASAPDLFLDLDRAIHVGLMVNELVTNALKHAFSGNAGEVHVGLHTAGAQIELCVSDNGTGLPAGLDIAQAKSLGLRIVYILARRLEATLKIQSDQGTIFRITLPLHAHAPVEPGGAATVGIAG
jgi:PAS domain S-box-containing protein